MNLIVAKEFERVEVSLVPQAGERKTELLDQASCVQAVTTPAGQALAVQVLREIKGEIKAVEVCRVAVKAPYRSMAEKVDAIAKTHVAELETEVERIEGLLSQYQAAEAAKERERQRLLNEEREKIRREQERLQREAEAKVRAAEEARCREMNEAAANARAEALARLQQAEKERQAQLAAAKEKADEAEKARLEAQAIIDRQKQEADEARKFREREAAVQAQQAEQRRKEAAESAAAQKALAQTELSVIMAAGHRDRASGMRIAQGWTHEVMNAAEVFRAHPEWCEISVRSAAVKEAIRQGMRECPGLRIFEQVKATAKAA